MSRQQTERKKKNMILKNLDYRKGTEKNVLYDEWNYFDNITSASTFYDDVCGESVVRCTFRDGNTVTIAVPYEAYLMSDNGKTIERLYPAVKEDAVSTDEKTLPTMQDAIDYAVNK